jgi:hypothetical protein
MKRMRTKSMLALALGFAAALAHVSAAVAQSNTPSGDTDYQAFSQFITQRNIFDPNRYPHETRASHPRPVHRHTPQVTLVGTMSYQKGQFAFFSGNDEDLKKILTVSGTIVGYTVTGITPNSVTLTGADKKPVTMQIGDRLTESNEGWQLTPLADAAGAGMAETSGESGGSSGNSNPGTTTDQAPAAPSTSLGNNEILKRLMQLREQENK